MGLNLHGKCMENWEKLSKLPPLFSETNNRLFQTYSNRCVHFKKSQEHFLPHIMHALNINQRIYSCLNVLKRRHWGVAKHPPDILYCHACTHSATGAGLRMSDFPLMHMTEMRRNFLSKLSKAHVSIVISKNSSLENDELRAAG